MKGSKKEPSALDAYRTAEPDEPVFTLQGGDVLAHETLKFYIENRRRAAVDLPHSRHRENELKRCTEAEEVLWAMKSYFKGERQTLHNVETESRLAEAEALDLHTYRVYCAGRLSNAFSEMNEMVGKLRTLGWDDGSVLNSLHNEIVALRALFNEIEPRPGMRIDNVHNW
jgi:hypothetical protein